MYVFKIKNQQQTNMLILKQRIIQLRLFKEKEILSKKKTGRLSISENT